MFNIKQTYEGCIMARYNKKHGLVGTDKPHPIYRLYYNIKTRCYNSSKHNYPFYQGKGIQMCNEWLSSVEIFYNWAINNGWLQGLVIDRIDSNGNYEPSNCRFITATQNSINARKNSPKINGNAKLTYDEVVNIKKDLLNKLKGSQIAKKYNVYKTAIYRIRDNKTWKHVIID